MKARAIELDGNRFVYTGVLGPGRWFVTSDDDPVVVILDADPTNPDVTEYSAYDWWQEAHTCGKLTGGDAGRFWKELLTSVVEGGYMTSEEAECREVR